MRAAYQGYATGQFYSKPKKFRNKKEILRVCRDFPNQENVSEESKKNWKWIKDEFIKKVESNIVNLRVTTLADSLPTFVREQLEKADKSISRKTCSLGPVLPLFWKDILTTLGYYVSKPICLHRRIERVMHHDALFLRFRCLDCDLSFKGLVGELCPECGGMLDRTGVEAFKPTHIKVTLGVLPTSFSVEKKEGKGQIMIYQCRNCGKQSRTSVF